MPESRVKLTDQRRATSQQSRDSDGVRAELTISEQLKTPI